MALSPFLLVLAAVGSIGGVALLIGLNALVGSSKAAPLQSLDDAKAKLSADFIAFRAGQGVVAPDGRGALIEEAGGPRVALVTTLGDRYVIRVLKPGEPADVEVEDTGKLKIKLADFTAPALSVNLGDAAVARTWAAKIEGVSSE